MQLRRFTIMLEPDTGGTGGGTQEPQPNKDEQEKTISNLQKELEAMRKEKAEAAAKAEQEKKAKMSEEEKRKAEMDDARNALYEEHISLQLQTAGLDDEYRELFKGENVEEIKKRSALIGKLIGKVKADTEALVKKELSKTGAPGSGTKDSEMSAEAYYESLVDR